MSKRPIIASALTVVALVLLLNFKTPDMALPPLPASNGVGGNSAITVSAPPNPGGFGLGGSPAGTNASTAAGASSPSGGNKALPGQFAGSAVQMPYGTVQVQVTIAGGKITDVTALRAPSGGHSGQIAAFATPQLRSEVLTAQSAQVNTISGATYTSQAYLTSLQAALDAAHFV
jgi:uncharacterized protein with FMN-binding domain